MLKNQTDSNIIEVITFISAYKVIFPNSRIKIIDSVYYKTEHNKDCVVVCVRDYFKTSLHKKIIYVDIVIIDSFSSKKDTHKFNISCTVFISNLISIYYSKYEVPIDITYKLMAGLEYDIISYITNIRSDKPDITLNIDTDLSNYDIIIKLLKVLDCNIHKLYNNKTNRSIYQSRVPGL